MKMKKMTAVRRSVALLLAGALCAGFTIPALAKEEIQLACDETYYATLNYYGALTDSSVVKSYRTYGNPVVTDYGKYDAVTNLTDRRTPKIENGKVTFDFTGEVPDKFYFEAKTSQPYLDFPWKLDLSYRLNGVPTKAEELAGKSGVVEIVFKATPNEKAAEYSRNNLVLTAVSAFNGDDILSLEAPGAQVQLLGNLYCVMYAVLPGEERECIIRVGTEDFSYGGMVFLAVPATLDQLSQIGELREAEEQIEASYRTITDSMDTILASMEGMGGSLNATANGLDQLNAGRAAISKGKEQVYTDLDAALDAAESVTEAMKPAANRLKESREAMDEAVGILNEMNDELTSARSTLERTRQTLNKLKKQISGKDAGSIQTLTQNLTEDMKVLQDMNEQFQSMGSQLDRITTAEDGKTILINGMTLTQIRESMSQLQTALTAYQALPDPVKQSMTDKEFAALLFAYQNNAQLQTLFASTDTLVAAYIDSASPLHGAASAAQQQAAPKVNALMAQAADPAVAAQLAQLERLQSMLAEYNMTLDQLKSTAQEYSGLLALLTPLCEDLSGLTDALSKNGGVLTATGDLANCADNAFWLAEQSLDHLEELNDLMNGYQPKVQSALKEAQTFTESASTGLTALVDAAWTGESLMKQSGPFLDAGTEQSLNGLSGALRSASTGLNQTANIRRALHDIDTVLVDQWNGVAGEERNLLQMDPNAPAQSITDRRNEGTASIQYVMRTQEIKESQESPNDTDTGSKVDTGTFWDRVKAMFQDFWLGLTSIF